MLDSGYDAPRIAHLLDGLPGEILGRLRSDRVMRRPTPSREEFHLATPKGGWPPKHGGEFVFGDRTTWGTEQALTVTDTRLYGKTTAQAWDRLHPRLTRRAAWLDHDGPLPSSRTPAATSDESSPPARHTPAPLTTTSAPNPRILRKSIQPMAERRILRFVAVRPGVRSDSRLSSSAQPPGPATGSRGGIPCIRRAPPTGRP